MATNPLFHNFRRQLLFHPSIEHSHFYAMAQQTHVQKVSNNKNDEDKQKLDSEDCPPQPKKRRTEKYVDDIDWDEDLEYTEQDLETLDIMESQAAYEPLKKSSGKTVEVAGEQCLLSVGSAQKTLFQAPGKALALRPQLSSASSSESSVYPTSSTSFGKSTSNISSAAGSLTSYQSSSHTSPEQSIEDRLHQRTLSTGRIKDAEILRTELQKAFNDLYARDGEVKFLRESLHNQETELEKLRAVRDERQDQEKELQKLREQNLKGDNERLQTQLEFKTQDCKQLQERCKILEDKLHQLQTSETLLTSSSKKSPGKSPSKSPKLKLVSSGKICVEERGDFPSPSSFMSTSSTSKRTDICMKNAETMTEQHQMIVTVPPSERPFQLDVPHSKGKVSGPHIVNQLLEFKCSPNGDISESGVLGLLHLLPSRLDLAELQYKRDITTFRLSPLKRSRSTDTRQLLSPTTTVQGTSQPIVKKENFLLAVQGLKYLLDSDPNQAQSGTHFLDAHFTAEGIAISVHLSGAVLILPLLNDYITHYIDILSAASGSSGMFSPNLSANSSKSCSYDSSVETLSSSLGLLLQEGTEYANNIETLALCALRVLRKLVCYTSEVQRACLASRFVGSFCQAPTDTSSSNNETDQEKDQKSHDNGTDGDDERSTTSSSLLTSPELVDTASSKLRELNIFLKLVRLASPGHECSGFNQLLIQEALDILIILAEKATDAELNRFHLVIQQGVLIDCINLQGHPSITSRALELLLFLVRSRTILLQLCNKLEKCIFLPIYQSFGKIITPSTEELKPQNLHITTKLFDCLCAIVFSHRKGISALMDNDCRCSAQFVPSLVQTMSFLMHEYRYHQNPDVLAILRKGVLLLHALNQWDPHFHRPVHLQYTMLMSGIQRIFKNDSGIPQSDVSDLEILWEGEQDDSDTSQDGSTQDESMVVQ